MKKKMFLFPDHVRTQFAEDNDSSHVIQNSTHTVNKSKDEHTYSLFLSLFLFTAAHLHLVKNR